MVKWGLAQKEESASLATLDTPDVAATCRFLIKIVIANHKIGIALRLKTSNCHGQRTPPSCNLCWPTLPTYLSGRCVTAQCGCSAPHRPVVLVSFGKTCPCDASKRLNVSRCGRGEPHDANERCRSHGCSWGVCMAEAVAV